MQIFGWTADRPACLYYRIRQPFAQLNTMGHETSYGRLLLGQRNTADIIVGQCIALPEQSLTWRGVCAEQRAVCVFEMDDDLFNIEPDNKAAYRVYSDPEIQAHLRANLEAAHLVTVTNERLAAIARQFNDHVAVLPNYIPAWMLTHEPRRWPFTVVGWAGGDSHSRDFGEVAKPLRRYLQSHPDVAFHNLGADYTSRVRTPKANVAHTGWTNDTESYLRSLDFTIGLAPLRDTPFARSKSPLKALELAALGIPCIASNIPPYSEFIDDGVTGVLVDSGRQFEMTLTEMVRDHAWRAQLGVSARKQATEHTIEANAWRWQHAYETALVGATQ